MKTQMIKIEFKEAQWMFSGINDDCISVKTLFSVNKFEYQMYGVSKSVTFGCPSELVPSRYQVLQQLGISKEQDEEMQLKYEKEI